MTPEIIVLAALLSAGAAIAVANADPIKRLDARHINATPWVQSQVPKPERAKRAKGYIGRVFASN